MPAESEDKYLEKNQFYQARSMEYKCEWILNTDFKSWTLYASKLKSYLFQATLLQKLLHVKSII